MNNDTSCGSCEADATDPQKIYSHALACCMKTTCATACAMQASSLGAVSCP
jgi:hypothetical protein